MGRRNKKSQAARRRYVPLDLDAEGQRLPKAQKSFADVVKPVERPQSRDDVESRQRFSEAPLSAEVLQTSETVALPTQPASLSLCDTSISPDITDFSIFPILHNNKTSKSTLHSRSNKLNDPVNKSVLSNKCNDSVTKPVLSNNLNHGQMTSITQPLNLPLTAMQVTDNYVKAIHSSLIQPVGVADNCVITGSFHQGDAQFGDAAERQCGPTSLIAALKCKMKNVLTWDCTDINDVVVQGTSLYNCLRNANKIKDVNQRRSYVSVTELPKKHYVWNTGFSVRYGESFTGAIDNENDNGLSDLIMPLDVALQRTLLNYNAGVVTIRSSTFAVVKEGSCFAFFDSHGRKVNKDGRLASSVTFFSSINSLYNYLDQLGRLFRQSLPDYDNEVLFEVTGVDVMTIPYDPVSGSIDGDANCSYACRPNTVDLTYTSCETNFTKADQKQVIDLRDDDDVMVSLTSDFDGPGKSHKELSGKPQYENPNKRKPEAMFGCDEVTIPMPIKSHKDLKVKPKGNTNKRKSDTIIASDDVCITSVTNLEQPFSPLTRQDENTLCALLELPKDTCRLTSSTIVQVSDIGSPCKVRNIKQDGNCFYRSLAFSICGDEEKHLRIRRAAVKHLQTKSSQFQQYLRDGYSSVAEYVERSRIFYSGSWATEIDIFAAASFLQCEIKTYNNDRWNCHSFTQSTSNIRGCIYLNHTGGNHYDSVLCVKNKENTMCAEICCQSEVCTRSQRKRQLDQSNDSKQKHADYKRQRYHNDETFKQTILASRKENYHKDECNRQKKRQHSRECYLKKYQTNTNFREKVLQLFQKRYKLLYANDPQFKTSKAIYLQKKYKGDTSFQEKLKQTSKLQYRNTTFKNLARRNSRIKYQTNKAFQNAVRNYSHVKYKSNKTFQSAVRSYSKTQYKRNYFFQENKKQYNKTKYHENDQIRLTKTQASLNRYNISKQKQRQIHCAIDTFRKNVSRGPEHVCSCCHRLLFRKQVIECKPQNYANRRFEVARMAKRCITRQYLHVCDSDCESNCYLADSPATKLWICHTCHRKILLGTLPQESVTNNLELHDIPPELNCLNSLEQHLIAKNICFMKLLCLPRGRQRGCHGPCVCVPINSSTVTNVLPRDETDDKMIRVKLKRKLSYKTAYEFQCVQTEKVRNALKYLIKNNKWYDDVILNDQWLNTLDDRVTDHSDEAHDDKDNVDNSDVEMQDNDENEEKEEELTYIKDQSGLVSDTSLQPIDIGSEIVDQHFQDILNMAPAEGNSPVSLLTDKTNESKSFPVLYPVGGPTFHSERESKITLSRYLNTRLLNADGRFARNTDFLFYAQYISEVQQVQSSISIALRKGSQKDVSSETLLNTDSLKSLLHNNEGYKFMRNIRGTPPYWMSAQKDLFAMIRQLSIPTFFASFSSADLRWPDFLSSLQRAEGKEANVADLDWSSKTNLVRSNPVTAARLFDERWHCFLKDVILSPAEPIGKIIDYFYRVEFQQRGSPHIHAVFWVQNAPKIGTNSDAEVTAFIDKYITCQLPTDTESELYETVNSVQKHSTRHSKTCRKKNTVCRFHFPRPPSEETFITKSVTSEDANDSKRASEIINTLRAALTAPGFDFNTTNAFFQSLGIDQTIFEWAYNMWSTKKTIVMKRNPSDIWINQYNKDLLRAWQGNMDIQFVTDAFSAAVYILSYVTKGEMEPGLLLQRTQMEALNGNLDAKAAFRQLGSVYLHNREVSAQEAVYRLTHMHLKECSRDVQFIPVGENPMRMSLPLYMLQSQSQHTNETNENIWMTNIVDRYTNRPQSEEMNTLCLASFCSEYRVISKSQIPKNKASNNMIQLNNNLGFVLKRTRSQPAIVRYPRFSPTKDPEKYYHSLLQLFLPHYETIHLKPPPFETYEHFYNNGAVKCGTDVQTVKSIVDTNKALFEKESNDIDKAEQLLQNNIDLTDAWAILAPESENERLHCLQLMKDKVVEDEDDNDIAANIPDLRANPQTVYSLETNHVTMPRQDALDLLRSLNQEQSAVFYAVRNWCLQKRFGKNPEPLRLFLTGGAGVGKSHLIKAIHYESTRLLQDDEHPDELPVILTAPTGVAAYNIGASTIHNTFSINANAALPYQPLGDEKVNCLRNKMRNMQILIIDEISMVDHKLFSYISGRLRQIKQTKDYSLFGNISVICLGDFYQLKPVKGTPLYADNKGVNLWENNFEIVELTTVVRQQNATFAETLNRLRVRKKTDPLNSRDVCTLKRREIEDDHSILHIYATNAEVQEYNVKKLNDTCPDVIQILAQDFQRNPKTGRMEKMAGYHTKIFNSCLPKCVQVGVGARILLLKNLNVQDGLTNGAAGVIVKIINGDDDTDLPKAIHVEFDDPNVGKIQRAQSNRQSERSTELQVQEDQISNNGGVRRQYPIGLAWAVTVHKCQGLTVEHAFVSLRKIFAAGQAYVALSRVKHLEGLIIDEFKDSAIYCDEKVQAAMENMPKYTFKKSIFDDENTVCKIALHNVQSLKAHIKDIEAHGALMKADCICLTETWLNADIKDIPQLPGFTFQHNPRINCYDESETAFAQLKQKKGGGVGIYCSDKVVVQVSLPHTRNLECLYFEMPHANINAAVLYRPRSYAIGEFRQQLLQIIHQLEKYPGKKVIMGDMNEDFFVSSTIAKLLDQHGYKQCVETFTSEKNTLIDHVYYKGAQNILVEIVPTYFSFHEAILISF